MCTTPSRKTFCLGQYRVSRRGRRIGGAGGGLGRGIKGALMNRHRISCLLEVRPNVNLENEWSLSCETLFRTKAFALNRNLKERQRPISTPFVPNQLTHPLLLSFAFSATLCAPSFVPFVYDSSRRDRHNFLLCWVESNATCVQGRDSGQKSRNGCRKLERGRYAASGDALISRVMTIPGY